MFKLKKQGEVIFSKLHWARNPFSKMKGLLGRKSLDKGEALIFSRAPSIHTFFMKFAIDIIFLDPGKKVIAFFEKVKPNRILPYVKSSYTVEMPEESVQIKKIKLGDQLIWEESGQTALEFTLLIATLILSITVVWPSLNNIFNEYIRNILDYLNDF